MNRRNKLRCEQLESRFAPAYFGRPWADHNITLSFVPDGTNVDGEPSNLFAVMQANGRGSTFQSEIIRAVQAWAEAASLNIGVVPDGGQPIGTAGAIQGDVRFGDIRVSARPLSRDVLAITVPPGDIGRTHVGDIIINSKVNWGQAKKSPIVYDLYSAMLQETGHALGVGNSDDPASPMFEYYSGVRRGIIASDVANIQNLYGIRSGDAYEGPTGNGTMATNALIATPASFNQGQNRTIVADADISTANDIDYYRFQAPTNAGPVMKIILKTSGLSLLAGRITAIGSDQSTVIASAQTQTPGQDIGFSINVTPSQTYYLRIEKGPMPANAVGKYQLQLAFDPLNTAPTPTMIAYYNDPHTDDSFLLSKSLNWMSGFGANSHYQFDATILDLLDVDVYKIRSPLSGQPATMTVSVRSTDANAFLPDVEIRDSLGDVVPFNVLSNAKGEIVLQVVNAQANKDYRIGVSARSGGLLMTGNYRFEVDFHARALNLMMAATGTLSAGQSQQSTSFIVAQGQVMNFALTTGSSGVVPSTIRAVIRNNHGKAVVNVAGNGSETNSALGFFSPGTYTITVSGQSDIFNLLLPNINYSLSWAALSDPIGPQIASGDSPSIYDNHSSERDDAYYSLATFAEPDMAVMYESA